MTTPHDDKTLTLVERLEAEITAAKRSRAVGVSPPGYMPILEVLEEAATALRSMPDRGKMAAQVREECARVADDERQAAIRAAELGGGASSPTYGHLVYAEAVAERIAAAIRSLNENKG